MTGRSWFLQWTFVSKPRFATCRKWDTFSFAGWTANTGLVQATITISVFRVLSEPIGARHSEAWTRTKRRTCSPSIRERTSLKKLSLAPARQRSGQDMTKGVAEQILVSFQ